MEGRALFRRVFSLIQNFLRLCRQKASRSDLADALRSVLSSAGALFNLRHRHPLGGAGLEVACAGCLAELQTVLGALETKPGGSAGEVAHALDSLIVLLVRNQPRRYAATLRNLTTVL
jgi:hypothetical protein